MSTHLLTSLAGPTWCGVLLYRWLLCANPCCPAPSFFVVYQEWLFAEGADIRKHSPAAKERTHHEEGSQHQWKHNIFKIHSMFPSHVRTLFYLTKHITLHSKTSFFALSATTLSGWKRHTFSCNWRGIQKLMSRMCMIYKCVLS